ncbi:secretory pathway protein Sec39-domain-containing protein [Flammula alnicola]|nr:secretory pathway protein Sec39-domain-containing protein [Flammula alnicola]
MASPHTSPYEIWSAFGANELTANNINQILGNVHDDLWVVSACVDRVVNDTAVQHTLLTLGVSRTDRVVERCTDIVALTSPSLPGSKSNRDTLLSHFQNAPTDALLCYLRSVLLRRLDRLNTYIEMEKEFSKNMEVGMDDVIEEWEDDPWADGNVTSSSKPTPQSKSTEPPPITLSDFLQNDLLWSACELAAAEAFDALLILLKKHTVELWPCRFRVQDCIPEHIHPSQNPSVFPTLDVSSDRELIPAPERWRQEQDFSELQDTQDAIKASCPELPVITDSDKSIEYTPTPDPLTAEELSAWYRNRVNLIMSSTGMVDVALALVQHGASQGIPLLDELGEELSLLSRLVYDAPQENGIEDDWTLDRWYSMDPITVVRAYLAHASPKSLPPYISHLVLPYLYVLEAKAERAGRPDPTLHTRILYEYILTTSLENAAAIFEASKPTLPTAQRTIKDDEAMVRVALACLYGSDSLNQWPTMSSIFECLPVWNVPQDEEDDIGEAADTTVASLGAFVTPSTHQPHCTAKDLLVFFQPLPFSSLSRALDILDVHLESGEILSRWSVPAPLRWFLQSSGNVNEQRAWANKMARRAGGKEDKLDGLEDWEWLFSDMRKLTGNGDPSARGAFCLLSKDEINSIFLSGMLSTGNFSVAKTMLHGPHHKLKLNPETIETVCLASSREFYDNASSGNYKFGDMKLAYECLQVPQPSENIVKEKDFIEATSRICSFNVSSAPGITISPIEIRLTKDKLSLISRVVSSSSDAYKHTQVILDLGYKLGYRHDTVAEVKILAMLADTALQAEDFACAYENSERMVETVASLRNTSPSGVDDTRVREASEVCWIACFQLGRQPEFPDLAKKMTLLGHALEFCPPDKIHDVLTAWRKSEIQDIGYRKERLNQRRSGGQTMAAPRKMNSMPSNVASSLRARLHDFHMPSPPLLSTPDAAALASRTFKSVAANFPFAVGHRGRSHASDADGRTSPRSESSRRTDGEDVSSQASRVFSKGIGWLIGADEEL